MVSFSIANASEPSVILVYNRQGEPKGELISAGWTIFRETLHRGSDVLVGTVDDVWRISSTGAFTRFADVHSPVWIAPLANGSTVLANGSGELFHIGPDGSRLLHRDTVILNNARAHGIDVAPDQCTVYYLESASLVVWNVCTNPEPAFLGPEAGPATRTALRLLPAGTFLAAYRTGVHRLAATGEIIGNYPVPTHGLALDIDRTSFWAGAGRTLVKVDIATGAILLTVDVPRSGGIDFLGVVGEPRASLVSAAEIPTANAVVLMALVVMLLSIALIRLR